MVHRVGPTPQISQPTGNSPEDVRALGRAFFVDSTDIRSRLRDLLPKDGAESMTGPLPMASFTTAALPPAADWEGATAYDTTTNSLVYSDGSEWRYVTSSAPIGWQTWTPTITASSGTFTSTTVESARFVQTDRLVHLTLRVLINTVGTATGDLIFTTPNTMANTEALGWGRESAATGDMLLARAGSTTTFSVANHLGDTMIAAGRRFTVAAFYEAAAS